jgi:hypothetical protein
MAGGIATKGMDMSSNGSGMGVIQEVDFSEKRIEGSVYLFDDWQTCTVVSGGTEFKEVELNYNMKTRQYEVKEGPKIKLVAEKTIDYFTNPFNARYKPLREIKTADGVKVEGISQHVTSNDKCNLVIRYSLQVKEPNYVPALDVGEKATVLTKKREMYYIIGNTAYKVEANKKKFFASLPLNSEQQQSLAALAKQEKLNLKDLEANIMLCNKINSL